MLRALYFTAICAAALSVAIVLQVRAKERAFERMLDAYTVAFPRAGISLQPGAAWNPVPSMESSEADPSPYRATMLGSNPFEVRLLPGGSPDDALTRAADAVCARCAADPLAVAGFYREEEFVAESGLRGLHLSYVRRPEPPRSPISLGVHTYLLTNRAGRAVSIEFGELVPADQKTAERIRRTLRPL